MLLAEHFNRPVAKVLTTWTEPSCMHIESDGLDFLNHVCGCTDRDESVIWALKELGSGANLYGEEWEENDGLVLFRGKVYIPLDRNLCHDIVEAHHDTLVTGHPGRWKTTELVVCNYWWPRMGCYITKYVKGCDLCNHTKMFLASLAGKLMPNHVLDHQWQVISVNLIMDLPRSHGYDALLVIVDHLSKCAHIILSTSDVTFLGVTWLF